MQWLLVVVVLCVVSVSSWGASVCSRLFDKTLSTPSLSFDIKSVDWLKTALKSGEILRLKMLDPYKDHNDFLSKILTETVQLVREDYNSPTSILREVPHAEQLLETILFDITSAQARSQVTFEFFNMAHSGIVTLFSLKNDSRGARTEFVVEISKDASPQAAVKKFYEARKAKMAYHFKYLVEAGSLPFPTFVELQMKDFIHLGIEFAPLGMTTKAKTSYDGVRDDSASGLFMHDISHVLFSHIRLAQLSATERAHLGRINRFLTSKKNYEHLTEAEKTLVEGYFFNVIHEDSSFKQLVQGFTNKHYYESSREIYIQNTGHPEATAFRSYDRLKDKTINFEYDLNMSFEQYSNQLRQALKKFVAPYYDL